MHEKTAVDRNSSIFSNGPSFNNTDGPAKWVKFDKNIFEKYEKILLTFYLSSGVWSITLNVKIHFDFLSASSKRVCWGELQFV